MRFCTSILLGLCLLNSGGLYAASTNELQHDVNFLTSTALGGRLTGSEGERIATQYIANFFQHIGLEPAGTNGSYFQYFTFTKAVLLGNANVLSIMNQKGILQNQVLNKDWRPLSFSDSVAFNASNLVLVGYGITAPALGKLPSYNSYQHANVKNKWVIIFQDIPGKIANERRQQLDQFASLRYKTFLAKEHGAKGVIFVSSSNAKQQLIPFASASSMIGSGMVVISVTDKTMENIFSGASMTLKKYKDSLDHGLLPTSLEIKNTNISGMIDIRKNIQQGRNVLAKLTISPKANGMIVIGAHVDHLGHGELIEQSGSNDQIYPGADDNASGVASLLTAAKTLSELKKQGKFPGKENILFAAWSGEELGILGSSHFVSNFMKPKNPPVIDAAINLDMIGHMNDHLILQGTGSSTDWNKIIQASNKNQAISIITQSDPYLPTDSTAFYLQGVPTLNFFTGASANYHTPDDKANTLNYEGMLHITQFLVNLIVTLDEQQQFINYHEAQMPSNKTQREFKIYLGTIPDYASADVSGVKLAGVAKNSPAEQAGLKTGDIIIELAGKHIHDIYDYTFALNSLQVGVPAQLVVQRGKANITMPIVARYRG